MPKTISPAESTTEWIYIKEAASIFGVTHRTMKRLLSQTDIPVQKLVRRQRVRRSDVEALLAQLSAPLPEEEKV